MNQIERIKYMEQILDKGYEKVENLQKAIAEYKQIESQLCELESYYSSPLWMKDLDDSNNGKLPKNLKCGVLSEDLAYNLFCYKDSVINEAHKLK